MPMSSVFQKRGAWWIRLKGSRVPGKWSSHPAPADAVTREDAVRYAKSAQAAIDAKVAPRASDDVTLREHVTRWLAQRAESGHDWKKDRGRMANHVLPAIGSLGLRQVTAAMIRELVHALRFRKKLANRTVRNVYSVLSACMRDAEIDGLIDKSPCVLDERQLGPVIDKDPEWRASALFTRQEAAAMVSDPRIPLDRRVVYAFGLLAGLRPGEAAALRWRSYEPTAPVLGRLTAAKAYSTTNSREKGTKTNAVKTVPVHPMLAALLAEWRSGWRDMFGREPEPDDLIVPLPPNVKRTTRTGERFRGWDYTGRRWREIDLPMLGWRARGVYDTRATFITLAIDDGADRDILRERVTHAKPRRDAFDGYDRGERWEQTCREVAKLNLATTVLPANLTTREHKLRRRVSKGQSGPPELRVIRGGKPSCEPSRTPSGHVVTGSCYQASRCAD
jgi:integrase